MILHGGCHCGAVRFAVEAPEPVALTECDCSICSMTGFLHLIVERDAFELLTDPAALSEYRFGTGTACHLFCRTCGIKSFYVPRSHPGGYSVNWRALDGTANVPVSISPFDKRDWDRAGPAFEEPQP